MEDKKTDSQSQVIFYFILRRVFIAESQPLVQTLSFLPSTRFVPLLFIHKELEDSTLYCDRTECTVRITRTQVK